MPEPHDPNRTADVPPAPTLDPVTLPPLLRDAAAEGSNLVVRPDSPEMPARCGDEPVQFFGEIARGGMGVILRGRDPTLGRDLAVKVLLEKHAGRPEVERRFVEEAQIGGQLQHPGVVPVYALGRFADGRPYFTMKLVKGRTLSALLAERADLAHDRPRHLNVFLYVAQTMAYAHAKGVIHRDLKPANVMVGAFGEVQVMDWGLAKVLAEGGVADEDQASRERQRPENATVIRTGRTDEGAGSDTQAGSLLGTPAYMPPEQAAGDVERLDRRADVFGLGAVLCELLTGRPPYVGRNPEETRRLAANGTLADAFARLDGCGADTELVALAKACLAAEPDDRPKDARAVADALTAYLDGVQERLRRAELDRAAAEVRATEERKRRRVQLALAASTVLFLGVAGAGLWWQGRQREARLVATARGVNLPLGRVEQLRDQAAARPESAKTVEDAEETLDLWSKCLPLLEEADNILAAGEPDPAVRQRIADLRTQAETGIAGAQARVERTKQREQLVKEADNLAGAKKYDAAISLYQKAIVVDSLNSGAHVDLGSAYEGKGQQEAALAEYQKALQLDPKNIQAYQSLGKLRLQRKEWGEAKALYLKLIEDNHETTVYYRLLFEDFTNAGEPEQAADAFRQALQYAPKTAAFYQQLFDLIPDSNRATKLEVGQKAVEIDARNSEAWSNLGGQYQVMNRLDDAIAACRRALEINPTNFQAHLCLGDVYAKKGDKPASLAAGQKAVELQPDNDTCHNRFGVILMKFPGEENAAIAEFRRAIEIDPSDPVERQNLAEAFDRKGDFASAAATSREALKLRPQEVRSYGLLSKYLNHAKDYDEAVVVCRMALNLDPTFVGAHNNLGMALRGKGRLEEAIPSFRRAAELSPSDSLIQQNLGIALREHGDAAGAVPPLRKVIELKPNNGATHLQLGLALLDSGDIDGAIASFRRTIEIDPRATAAHTNLANALLRTAAFEEALANTKKAHELGRTGADWLDPNGRRVRWAEQNVELDRRFADVLNGTLRPSSPAEAAGFARVGHYRQHHVTATRLFTEAFAADPGLARDLAAPHVLIAIRAAAQAGQGVGPEAARLDGPARARHWQQARDWVRVALAAAAPKVAGKLSDGVYARSLLLSLRSGPELANVRGQEALAQLPEAERADWAKLWADVADLLKRAEAK
jgi:serine/threonine-protein kinase